MIFHVSIEMYEWGTDSNQRPSGYELQSCFIGGCHSNFFLDRSGEVWMSQAGRNKLISFELRKFTNPSYFDCPLHLDNPFSFGYAKIYKNNAGVW
jgi:hypothetical protein